METTNHPRNFDFFLKGTNGKAVLLIHGITGTPSEMRYLGKRLHKAGFSVLCNTLPRHCGSLAELKRVTWQEIASACAKDLESLKKEYAEIYVGGLSMGALMAAHLAYKNPSVVSKIIALAPTIFYDGWAVPKHKVLMDVLWHVPFLRNSIDIKESWPYGLKNEYLRAGIEKFYRNAKASGNDDKTALFGSPFFPMCCLYQHHLLTKVVKKELPCVKTPIILIHAKEDDMTSLKNARYVYDHIASSDKSLVILDDSYHMITIDQEKDRVAQEVIKFLR
ncbi:MAG: alpha/beta fold hydrolase [Candidatus Omnitrophota bacterium]|nr:alpha/beta fold hydrolase [Candidatus Omnitrophota bacterium]